jgi:hypothetical protein
VTVVELDAEHAVPQRLDDLAGHLDLVFLLCDECLLSRLLRGYEGGRPPWSSLPPGVTPGC